jgi:hypothetical protein
LSSVVDRATTYYPVYIIYIWLVHSVVSLVSKLSVKTSKLSYYFDIVNHYVRYDVIYFSVVVYLLTEQDIKKKDNHYVWNNTTDYSQITEFLV